MNACFLISPTATLPEGSQAEARPDDNGQLVTLPHGVFDRLAAAGAAVLVISSELPELLLLSHRIGIVNRGRLTQTLENGSHLNEDVLMRHATTGGLS